MGRVGDTSPIAPKGKRSVYGLFALSREIVCKIHVNDPNGYDPRFPFGRRSTGGIASTAVVRLPRTYAPHIRILQTRMITAPGSPHAAQAIPAFLTRRTFSVKRLALQTIRPVIAQKKRGFPLGLGRTTLSAPRILPFSKAKCSKARRGGVGGCGGKGNPTRARRGGPLPPAETISCSGKY